MSFPDVQAVVDRAPRRQVVDLFHLLQPTARAAPRGFYPAVGRSVEFPPLPCLTLKHAKACDKKRNMPKRLITASAQMISIKKDCRPLDWVSPATPPHDQANAMLLQTDRGLAWRPMRCPRGAAAQETMRSTSRARD